MFKEIKVVFKVGLSEYPWKLVLLHDDKSAVVVADTDGVCTPCLCCISTSIRDITMLEKTAKALGVERLLWSVGWRQKWAAKMCCAWPQTIKHEFVIPDRQCKTQDEFLRLCDKIAAQLP